MLDEAIKEYKSNWKKYNVGYWTMEIVGLSELCYVEDKVIMGETEKEFQETVNTINVQ